MARRSSESFGICKHLKHTDATCAHPRAALPGSLFSIDLQTKTCSPRLLKPGTGRKRYFSEISEESFARSLQIIQAADCPEYQTHAEEIIPQIPTHPFVNQLLNPQGDRLETVELTGGIAELDTIVAALSHTLIVASPCVVRRSKPPSENISSLLAKVKFFGNQGGVAITTLTNNLPEFAHGTLAFPEGAKTSLLRFAISVGLFSTRGSVLPLACELIYRAKPTQPPLIETQFNHVNPNSLGFEWGAMRGASAANAIKILAQALRHPLQGGAPQ